MAPRKKVELTEEQKEIKADLTQKAALEAVAKTEGGKLLVRGFLADIVADVDSIAVRFKDLSHAELMGICASLKANIDIYRVFTHAGKNRAELQKMLELALKPSEDEEE